MLLLFLTEDGGNVNPNLDSPESNLGVLQTSQFSIGQILTQAPQRRKEGEKDKGLRLVLGKRFSWRAVACQFLLLSH